MTGLSAFFHLFNFVLPALCVGTVLALWGRRLSRQRTVVMVFVNSAVGVLALLMGLVVFGVDGKMLSYALLIVGCSISQLGTACLTQRR